MTVLYAGMAASQRIAGTGRGAQNVFAVENGRGSNRLVCIRRGTVYIDHTAQLTAVKPTVNLYRATFSPLQEGVCLIDKGTFDTAQTSDPYVRIWSACSPDGAGIGAMVSSNGARHWSNYGTRMHDTSGQIQALPSDTAPALASAYDIKLVPGEAFVVTVEPATATSDPATNNWIFNCVWTEETLPVFTISGVVTLSAVGVVGAEVAVLVADDTSLTNAYLWAVVTTTTGGAWTCDIPAGKVAYAYAQNYTGGIYYTAPGNPFIT